MEEDLGFLERAAELRSFNMHERVQVVKPTNFATTGAGGKVGGLLAPVFQQIARWFQRYEEERERQEPELPELLAVEVAADRARAAARAGDGRQR